MKKIWNVTFLIISLAFLTGCSKEKILDCTISDNSTGIKMSQNVKSTFKKNKVKDIEIFISVEIEEKYKNYKNTLINRVENEFSSYKNKDGVEFNTDENELGFSVKINADLDKMNDDSKEELDMIDTTGDYEKTKEALIADGYTCK